MPVTQTVRAAATADSARLVPPSTHAAPGEQAGQGDLQLLPGVGEGQGLGQVLQNHVAHAARDVLPRCHAAELVQAGAEEGQRPVAAEHGGERHVARLCAHVGGSIPIGFLWGGGGVKGEGDILQHGYDTGEAGQQLGKERFERPRVLRDALE